MAGTSQGTHRLCEVIQVDIVEGEQVIAGEPPRGHGLLRKFSLDLYVKDMPLLHKCMTT